MRRRFIKRSVRELTEASADIAAWLRWDIETISDFHAYVHMFKVGTPGGNVHETVLSDALRFRGMTLDQLRAAAHKKGL